MYVEIVNFYLKINPWFLLLQACAPDLEAKLGDPVDPTEVVGTVSPNMCERYGFEPACLVVPFTGDNPSSLAGLRLGPHSPLAISLGSSDTVMAWIDKYPYSEDQNKPLNGSVFVNPVCSEAYMSLLW